MNHRLKCKCITTKLLEGNMGENLWYLGLGK